MPNFYWRKKSFEGLGTLRQRLSEYPELALYVEYLDLLEKGLRKQGLERMVPLVAVLRALDVSRQRELASVLCEETLDSLGHNLTPHPLAVGFLEPVLKDWVASEPDAAEPRKWTGNLTDLRKAVELEPTCDETRCRLIEQIIKSLWLSTHHLPEGYLGYLEEDEELLTLADREIAMVVDDEVREKMRGLIEEERMLIEAYKGSIGSNRRLHS